MPLRLSSAGAKRVNWNTILDATAGARKRGGTADPGAALEAAVPSHPDRQVVRMAFQTAREQFETAGAALRGVSTIMIVLASTSAAITIAGVVLASMVRSLATGVALSTAGVTGMFVFFSQVYRLGRDQVLFEFIPAKYELALTLARTPEEYSKILDQFLDELKTRRPESKPDATS